MTGQTAHFRFNGMQVKIYTVKERAGGNIGYSLDGGPEQIISNYNAVRIGNTLSYTSAVVTSGNHDLRIRVVGTYDTLTSLTDLTAQRKETAKMSISPGTGYTLGRNKKSATVKIKG